MNVVYSSSDLYAELCGISIVSLCESNKATKTIHFFVIDNSISENNKNRLIATVNKYKRDITFIPSIDIAKLAHMDIYTGRWNISTFFRLYLASLLPSNISKTIYLDCDTIVRGSLDEIYNSNFDNYSVLGVDDCRSDLYRIDVGCKEDDLYINNGFMVVDVDRWRKEEIEKQFTDFITSRHGDCTYMDQAPLNGVLIPKNEVKEIPAKYNSQRIFFDFTYKELLKLRKPTRCLSEQEYEEAVKNPIVVHFTPVFITGTRPWQTKDSHPFRKDFLHYKSISEWKDTPLRKDDRKFLKKVMTIICKLMPRKMMIKVMSYLHATWYPKKRIKQYQKGKQQ